MMIKASVTPTRYVCGTLVGVPWKASSPLALAMSSGKRNPLVLKVIAAQRDLLGEGCNYKFGLFSTGVGQAMAVFAYSGQHQNATV